MTAGGARAKAAGKAAPAQNRRGSSCWSRKSRCCGLGTLRDCSLAAASVACSALALTNAALAKPTATVALANPAIVIAASVVSQSTAAVALAATAVALSPPPGHHHRHRHRPRRHGLRHPLPGRRRVAAFAFAFAFAATAQPAQSASAALAALATVEGRGASLIRDRASSRRFDRCAERQSSWFSLRFWLKAPHKRQIFSRGCRPAPRGGLRGPRSAFFTRPAVSGAHFGSTTANGNAGPPPPAAKASAAPARRAKRAALPECPQGAASPHALQGRGRRAVRGAWRGGLRLQHPQLTTPVNQLAVCPGPAAISGMCAG